MLFWYAVTVKGDANPDHNPKNKITSRCPIVSEDSPAYDETVCTDSTGIHHTFMVAHPHQLSVHDVAKKILDSGLFGHITRVEGPLAPLMLDGKQFQIVTATVVWHAAVYESSDQARILGDTLGSVAELAAQYQNESVVTVEHNGKTIYDSQH